MGRGARIVGGVALAVGAAVGWRWTSGADGSGDVRPARMNVERASTDGSPRTPVRTERLAPDPLTEPAGRTDPAPYVQVGVACGIALEPACDGRTCVALARMPDLDALPGWLNLVGTSPAFVLGVAARDLGLPPAVSSCGDAVLALSRAGGVQRSVPLASGDDAWCAAPDGSDAATALCARAASARFGVDPDAWSHARVLRFDR